MTLRGRGVLVTGGLGFIGSHLVDALVERGARVRVIDNLCNGKAENIGDRLQTIEMLRADIRDLDACTRACRDADVVFHLAALGSVPRSLVAPALTLTVNVAGTANIFQAAREAGARRIVYASSSSVYGDAAGAVRTEGGEGAPLSPYAASKVMTEKVADTYARCYGFESVGLRFFNVFGPRQDPQGPYAAVVPRFVEAVLGGAQPVIYGDGRQSRDFTFVDNVVGAMLHAATCPVSACGGAYNVGCGRGTDLLELLGLICRIAGREVTPRFADSRPGDVRQSIASIELARRQLGYEPATSIEEGLQRTIAWYRWQTCAQQAIAVA